MVKKKLLASLVMGACICGGQTFGLLSIDCECAVAEAKSQPKIEVMERELKKNKGYESSDIYRRSHDIIYGDEKPGRDGRVRIAVVINGDENMVVEDRIKNQVYSHLREKFPIDYFAVMKGSDINSKLLQYAEDMYYDQREYATTRETEYNRNNSSKGISIGISGQRDTGDVTSKNHNNVYYDKDPSDEFYNEAWYGVGDRDTDINHKGWGGNIRIGAETSHTSGDETRVTKSSRVDVDGIAIPNRPRGLADMRRLDYVRAGRECNYDYVFVLTLTNGKGKIYGHDFLVANTNTVTKNIWLRVRLVDVKTGDYLYRNDIAARGETHNGHINGRVLERSVANAMKEAMDDIKVSER